MALRKRNGKTRHTAAQRSTAQRSTAQRSTAPQTAAQKKETDQELLDLLGDTGQGKAKPKLGRKRALILGGCVLLLGGGAVAAILLLSNGKEANTEAVYREYTVEHGDITVGQTESSSVSLTREVITFPVSATVEEVYVKAGSSVKEGDPLIRLSPEDIETGLKSYELQLEIAGLELEQAKLQLETRLLQAKQQLESSKQAGQLASDNEGITLAELQLALTKAQASLASAQEDLYNYNNLSLSFESDYRRLKALEDAVEDAQDAVSSAQRSAGSATDYATLRENAEKELASAYALLNSMAVNLSRDTTVTNNATTTDPAGDAGTAGSYFSMSSASPGTLYTTQQTAYEAVKTAYTNLLNGGAITDATTLSNLKSFLSALSSMETQASNVRNYTQQALGSTTSSAAAQSALSAAQDTLSAYQTAYSDFKEYYNSTYGNVADAEELAEKILSLETDVETAKISLNKAQLSSETGATEAEQKKESALNEASTAGTTYELTEMELSQSVDAAQEQYNDLNSQIEEVKELLSADGTVYAPCNGMVSQVAVETGDSVTVTFDKETQQITNYAQLMVMTNISDVYVPITISEEDILSVAIGQTANVTMNAFPGRTFAAEVDTISVESSRAGAATVSYTVSIRFSEVNELDMYEGMSAEITLVQRTAADVLYISNQAVSNTGGVATVLKRGEGGEGVTTEVTTGFSDGRYVEILSGLSEGDVVLVESAVGRT